MNYHPDKSASEFYDALASNYDAMTEFEKRFIREKPFFETMVEKHKIKTALDAGCGTGFHSLLLFQLGVTVTSVDVSTEMLQRLQLRAKQMNLSVKTIESHFEDLQKNVHEKFDAIICMGNSLAHLLTKEALQQTLDNFYALLNDQGILLIQNLNYDRILSKRERILNVKDVGQCTFIRFYDYKEKTVDFNILRIERTGNVIHHSLETVELMPWLEKDFQASLSSSGFRIVNVYGAITLEPFNAEQSKDLVFLAQKSKSVQHIIIKDFTR